MGLPLGFFIGPGIPFILAQKDARLLAAPSTEAESANAQFKLYLDTSGTKGFTFDAIITSASFGTTVGDLTTVSCSFQTCGTITGVLE